MKRRGDSGLLNLIIFTESAEGLLNLQSICERAGTLKRQGAPFDLQGVVFGSDDFCADIGNLCCNLFKRLLQNEFQITI